MALTKDSRRLGQVREQMSLQEEKAVRLREEAHRLVLAAAIADAKGRHSKMWPRAHHGVVYKERNVVVPFDRRKLNGRRRELPKASGE